MADQDIGAWTDAAPCFPEPGEIVDPLGKVTDMSGDLVRPKPARPRLPAPVDRGYAPTRIVPFGEAFEIFLVMIPAPGKEQQRAARRGRVARGGGGCGKVDPADLVSIGRCPPVFLCEGRDRPAVDPRTAAMRVAIGLMITNTALLRLVTIW